MSKINSTDKRKYAEMLVSEVIKIEEEAIASVNQIKPAEAIAKISAKLEEVYKEYENQATQN